MLGLRRFLPAVILLFWFFVLLAARSESQTTGPVIGVIVEGIAPGSMPSRSGLQKGDLLLTWSRGEQRGNIAGPWDLVFLEMEQAPYGQVELKGCRGSEDHSWNLNDETWGIKTRPAAGDAYLSHPDSQMPSSKKDSLELPWQAAIENAHKENASPMLMAALRLRIAEAFAQAGKWDQAGASCHQAAQSFVPDDKLFPYVLKACADVFFLREPGQKFAQQFLEEALTAARSHKLLLTQSAVLSGLARIDLASETFTQGEERLLEAVKIQERLVPQSLSYAFNLNRLGVIYQTAGNMDEAKRYVGQAMELRRRLAPGSSTLASSLENYANVLSIRGETTESRKYIAEACTLFEKLSPGTLLLAGCYVDAGNSALSRRDLREAEERFKLALDIQRKLNPHGYGAAASLNDLALVYMERGQLAEAEAALRESVSLKEEIAPGTINAASGYDNLGLLYAQRGNYEEAQKFTLRAVEMLRKSGPETMELGNAYEHLGQASRQLHRPDEARRYLEQGLPILEKAAPFSDEASNIHESLADVAMDIGDITTAKREYQAALNVREKTAPGSWMVAESLLALARVNHLQNADNEAADLYEHGLNALESQTAQLGGTDLVQSGFRAKYEAGYKDYLDLLVSQNRVESAFNVLERSRARSLLQMLAATTLDLRKGVDPQLLEQQRALQADIAGRMTLRLSAVSGKDSRTPVAGIDRDIHDLLEQLEGVEQRIRETNPEYAALTRPRPISANELRPLMGPDSLLIEYSLGTERSFAFVVSGSGLHVYTLPGRAGIEELARNFHKSISVPQSHGVIATKVSGSGNERLAAGTALALSKAVLQPLAAELGHKRLLIVPDGALHYVPFAALADPAAGLKVPQPLILNHEIDVLPSASVLAVLREHGKKRRSPPKLVAVLADPVFATADERLAHRSSGNVPAAPASADRGLDDDRLTRSVHDVGLAELPRLLYTRLEAAEIVALAPAEKVMKRLDFAASRDAVLAPELGQYRVIHLATHGLLNSEHPELSGLVFSLVDEQGKPRNGFLSLEDIYNLDLSARLVVLSACETGLGKEISGEGMIGLTRGFMHAGASSVMASLWRVSDAGTARLMRDFYAFHLRDGLAPAAALRRAQLRMWKEARWSSPYYWSAFQIQGDWQ